MTYDEIIAQFSARGKADPFMYRTDQLAKDLGYSGTARTITGYGGSPSESTGMGTEAEYALTPEFKQFLGGYQYSPAVNDGRNAALDIFDSSGKMVHDDYRVGDHKGTAMKIAGAVIPALTMAGFGAGAYGLLGGGGAAAAAPAAGNAAPSWLSGLGAENMAAIDAFTAANPVTAGSMLEGMPAIGAAAGGFAGGGIGAATAVDSLGSGLTQAQINAAALGPNGSLPGLSSSGLLGSAMDAAGTAGKWMKDNPMLGKLLMSGGMGLLATGGGGGGGSAPAPTYGPPQQWTSPIQQGIQSTPQQQNPAAIQRPQGLLAQGQQNDGAWRYLKGQ